MLIILASLFFITCSLGAEWSIKLKEEADPVLFAQQHGFIYKGPVEFLPTGYYMFEGNPDQRKRDLVNNPEVLYIRQQRPRTFFTRYEEEKEPEGNFFKRKQVN